MSTPKRPMFVRPRLWMALGAVGLCTVVCTRHAGPPPADPAPAPEAVGPPPSWQSPVTPVIEPFPGTTGISAASCGQCHTDIYAEWKTSTHAHAWVDPQFQAELHKDPEVAWLCINCHTPLGNQQEALHSAGPDVRHPVRTHNPDFDVELQQEGITCLTCHWREEGIAAVHEDVVAPHPTVYTPELRSEQTCTGCHQAVARLEDALVCTFNTGNEWLEAAPGKTCPECHMPAQHRASAPGAPERDGGMHTWPGSLIPKDTPTPEERALMAKHWQPGVDLSLQVDPASGVPTATLTNVRAGHMLPTGDPERYFELSLTATDPTGTVVGESVLHIGQKWEWWPVAKKVSDNRIAPGEAAVLTLDLPDDATGLTITAQVDHVRISPENASYHDLGDYPTRLTVAVESTTVGGVGRPEAPVP